jgi:hypothetical protein
MVVVDRDGNIVLVNTQVERIFGYARLELLGKSIEFLIPQRFRGKHPEYRSGLFRRSPGPPHGSGSGVVRVGLSVENAAQLAGMETSEWAAIEAGHVRTRVDQLRSMAGISRGPLRAASHGGPVLPGCLGALNRVLPPGASGSTGGRYSKPYRLISEERR